MHSVNMPIDRRKTFDEVFRAVHTNLWNFSVICLCFCLSHLPAESSQCPAECKCLFLEKTVNCSNRSLRKLPLSIPQDVAILSFHNNKLSGTELTRKTFSHLTNLQLLDLSDNRLKTVNFTFPSRVFVKTLNFDHCILIDVPIVYGAEGITKLFLSHNSISNITRKFDNWPLLETLDLSFNKIRILPNNTFLYLTRLKHLDLNKNRIHIIESRALLGLSSLDVLLLNRNRIKDLKNFTHCLSKEESCIGGLANLRYLDFSRNHLSRIDGLTFQGMFKLETLILSHNNIAFLGDAAFYKLPELSSLQLDYNKVTAISDEWLYILENLQNLSLSNNNISAIELNAWKYCPKLKHLNLSCNQLVRLRAGMFEKLLNLLSLDISMNLIAVLEDATFDGMKSLHHLDLSQNRLSSTIEDLSGSFQGLANVRFLSLRSNSIRFLTPSIFTGFDQLSRLDLTDNQITSIANMTFDGLKNLQQLRIDSVSLLCDCQLASFALWLNSRQSEITSQITVSCFHPLELKEKRLRDVDPSQLVCGEHPVPSLLQQPADIVSLKGENITLECSASATLNNQESGFPSSSINMSAVWRKGPNKDIIEDSKFIRIRNIQRLEGSHVFFTSLLLFYDIDYGNDDSYSCMIKNDYGHAVSSSAHLRVVTLPRIIRLPENKTVKYDSEVKVYCQAFGYPLPKISWERADGKVFFAALEHRLYLNDSVVSKTHGFEMTKKVPLHIEPVKPVDAGRYKCTAKSDVGEQSTFVDIIVQFPPIIEGMLEEVKSLPGETTVMKCMVLAHPTAQVQWLLDGKKLQPSARHFLAADNQLLVIVDTQIDDQGWYTCEATNSMGVKRNTTHLKLSKDGLYSGSGDELWGLPSVLLVVLVCVLATSLVWLLYFYCSKRKTDDVQTDSFHQGLSRPNCTSEVLIPNQEFPHHTQSCFHSFPRNSRADVTIGPGRSRSSECIRCRYNVNHVRDNASRVPTEDTSSQHHLSRSMSRRSKSSSVDELRASRGRKKSTADPPELLKNPP